MSKKPRKKNSKTGGKSGSKTRKATAQRYKPGEIVLAILGAAILVLIAGIVITAILE